MPGGTGAYRVKSNGHAEACSAYITERNQHLTATNELMRTAIV